MPALDVDLIGQGVTAILAGAAAVYGWITQRETRANGGMSMRDAVNRIEVRVDASLDKMDRMGARLEARQHVFSNSLEYPVFETDENGNWTTVNEAFLTLTGRQADDLLGSDWINVVCPTEQDDVWESYLAAIERRGKFERTFTLCKRTGGKVKVHATATCSRSRETGWFGTVKVLVRKKAAA